MSTPTPQDDAAFEELLAWLRDARASDFTGYKRPSLHRLVDRRMRVVGVTDYRAYLDLLQVEPSEAHALLDTLLINVTSFFRDDAAGQSLRDEHLPAALSELSADEPIRVWSAACATGQEAYSLAILLHEALGEQDYLQRVKVYATDIDEDALTAARAGRYSREALDALTDEQRATYFVDDGDALRFRPDLRHTVIFGRHDLLRDAPISKVLLLSCRNALMYFTPDSQAQVLERFSFSLHEHGLLMLGKAEMLLTQSHLFTPLDLPQRIFRAKAPSAASRLTALAVGGYGRDVARRRVTEAAFSSAPAAQVVLDARGHVVRLNERAQRDLPLSPADLGRPFAELELARSPVELRGTVAEVAASRSAVLVKGQHLDGATTWDITVEALEVEGELLGLHLIFVDVTERDALRARLAQQTTELATAYEELQSSSEELETTNEELQSAVEELETTNEELQSTNEELETMNEELQSTNEELQTLNDELRERTHDVDRSNAFMHAVLAGMDMAVVVVDGNHRVQLWNSGAERMLGLRSFEVEGRPVVALELGATADDLQGALLEVTNRGREHVELVREVLDRTGTSRRRRISAHVVEAPFGRGAEPAGAVLTLVDLPSDD